VSTVDVSTLVFIFSQKSVYRSAVRESPLVW